jgi:pimeloyl-ACP methyl ester carboxylesterase/transcriptional regulator with XRE-family HTH domain
MTSDGPGEPISFGALLKRYRLSAGLTHERLAERASVSARAISDLERGVSRVPRRETVTLLADALHLGVEQRAALEAAVLQPLSPAAPPDPLSPTSDDRPHTGIVSSENVLAEKSKHTGPLFEVRYVPRADGAVTAYGMMGAGPGLLMPPGLLSHLEWYVTLPHAAAFLGPLAEHRTLILYDRHGCGLSDRDRTDFTAEDDMQDIEAVADAAGGGTLDLLGISWGALPVLTFAARYPERVHHLVLYGAGGLPDVAPSVQVLERQAALAALRRADIEVFVRAVVTRVFPSGVDEANFRSFVQLFRMAASVEMQERLEQVRFGVQGLLAEIKAPTLILHRRGDLMASFANAQYYARHIPGARFLPLEGDAHFPWVGDWQSVVTPILQFLLAREIDAEQA